MTDDVLVAGIGNLFLGDDGFGSEVVRYLADPAQPGLPANVRMVDYGIRGVHLLYDLLEGFEALVVIDALPGRARPGEVVVLEVRASDLDPLGGEVDAHSMNPVSVLAGLAAMGEALPLTYIVGAAPEGVEEGIGLSSTMTLAVPEAAREVRALLLARPWTTSRLSTADREG